MTPGDSPHAMLREFNLIGRSPAAMTNEAVVRGVVGLEDVCKNPGVPQVLSHLRFLHSIPPAIFLPPIHFRPRIPRLTYARVVLGKQMHPRTTR